MLLPYRLREGWKAVVQHSKKQEGEKSMATSVLADLIATAEQLSPERSPAQAVDLNQQILLLNPLNAAAHARLARAYQAQRKFAEAKTVCQEALRLNPGSTVAKQRLQRISEDYALATQAQAVTTFEDAFRRGVVQKDDEYAGLAIAYLWQAAELSTSPMSYGICDYIPSSSKR